MAKRLPEQAAPATSTAWRLALRSPPTDLEFYRASATPPPTAIGYKYRPTRVKQALSRRDPRVTHRLLSYLPDLGTDSARFTYPGVVKPLWD